MNEFQFFPEQASNFAERVDDLYIFLIGLTGGVSVLIAFLLLYFAAKYRKRSVADTPTSPIARTSHISHGAFARMEIVWIGVMFLIFMGIFLWGAAIFTDMRRSPADVTDIYVTGKQWMWKVQHLSGQREINELHLPVGRRVRLIMTSQDVVHSFFVPAFRVKQDVVPGRYSFLWFQPTKVGTYHLFCAEYCGTSHSGMIGRVVVMDPADYQAWSSQGGEASLADVGLKVFQDLGCATCHLETGQGRGPDLRGLYGRTVELQAGDTVVADDDYIRESILAPQAKMVAGFQPVMPSFKGLVTEEQIVQLIAYVRSLGTPSGATREGARAAAADPARALEAPLADDAGAGGRALDDGGAAGPEESSNDAGAPAPDGGVENTE